MQQKQGLSPYAFLPVMVVVILMAIALNGLSHYFADKVEDSSFRTCFGITRPKTPEMKAHIRPLIVQQVIWAREQYTSVKKKLDVVDQKYCGINEWKLRTDEERGEFVHLIEERMKLIDKVKIAENKKWVKEKLAQENGFTTEQ